jgi:RNA polymerase sigma-70 factor (ECF subfamily)
MRQNTVSRILRQGTESVQQMLNLLVHHSSLTDVGGDQLNERELIDRWRQGDSDAAHDLVARYYPRMLALFYRLTGTRDQAEELTQDLFVRLTRHVSQGNHVDYVAAWVNRTALNLWRDQVRRAINARDHGITANGGDEALLHCQGPDLVEDVAITHMEHDVVRNAILELTPAHREAIVLYHYQGLPYDQIAAITDVPVGTVRSRIHYAIKQLRSRLEPDSKGGIQP